MEIAIAQNKQLARPLRVLVPLIKDGLHKAKMAADTASRPYMEIVGTLLAEARPQFERAGEFYSWTNRNFGFKQTQANTYLSYGKYIESSTAPAHFSSLDEYKRVELGHNRVPGSQRDKDWREPVKKIMSEVDLDSLNLRQSELKRAEERDAQRRLALQLIDIGYKALATKLHPDKGGSRDAMARLNEVRDRLKAHA